MVWISAVYTGKAQTTVYQRLTVQSFRPNNMITDLLAAVTRCLHIVNLHPTILADGSIIRHRTKRWAFYEIHKCGRIKGYSCLEHRHCYERYLRRDMVCFEVYPCLSSYGIPVNNHNDPINYVREQTAKLLKELNLTLPLHNQPKVSVISSPSPPSSSSAAAAA
ncbi:unnamed protein product [Schistosoma mattheei]|uniref:Uncharacterized protein n=1 Tax=Schistosoma mattheei TaxID=31246 RepID=A0A183NDL7_9TREM|nr:unnamed protein product [Schistosoma mattheei]